MQSRISFFNKTLFRKNMTRFAPVWILYTVCLLAGLFVTYSNYSNEWRLFWFAANLAEDVTLVLIGVNLLYALLTAQLLFGDLYNSRMCNALHTLPLRRESFLVTTLLSGICFSLLPTLIMTLAALPMISSSIFVNAWQIPLLVLLAANLSYLCFFGIAAFSAMCVGNRFTMAAGYGLLNLGSCLAYYAADILYRPLMYGFVTPTEPFFKLSPATVFFTHPLYKMTPSSELREIIRTTKVPLSTLSAAFTLTDAWGTLFLWAAIGIGLMAAAMLLYRRRHLECAGDAVAFRCLVPVFKVFCSLFVMLAAYYVLYSILGFNKLHHQRWLILALGLATGWFLACMMVERTTRVFRLKALPGLAALGLAIALTFAGTYFDVFGIERRIPDIQDVESVALTPQWGGPDVTLTAESDIALIRQLHGHALENRNDNAGLHVIGYDGSYVRVEDDTSSLYDITAESPEYTYIVRVNLTYILKNGSSMRRTYNIWTEQEEGRIARSILTRWESLTPLYSHDGVISSRLDLSLADFRYLSVDSYTTSNQIHDLAAVRSFLDAVRADCEAGSMAQGNQFHRGYFRSLIPVDNDGKDYYPETESFSVYIRGENYGWNVNIYPDCENSLRWLKEHDLLTMETIPDRNLYWTHIHNSAK